MTEATCLEALEAVYEGVASGTLSGSAQDFERVKRLFGERWADFGSAYGGSLSAAEDLHRTLVPEWTWCVGKTRRENHPGYNAHLFNYSTTKSANANCSTAARAWLCAILQVLMAKERRRAHENPTRTDGEEARCAL